MITVGLGLSFLGAQALGNVQSESVGPLLMGLLTPAFAGLATSAYGVCKKMVAMMQENKMIETLCKQDPEFKKSFYSLHGIEIPQNERGAIER